MSKDEKKPAEDFSELLAQVQGGSGEAFATLVEKYTPLLESETARYRTSFDEDDFDDISQGALIAFYRAALAYHIGSDVTFGLFAKICGVNGIADVLRFVRKKSADVDIADVKDKDVPHDVVDTEELVVSRAQYSHFLGSVRHILTELEMKVLRLYLLGNTYAEIAAAIGKSEKSVDNALRRIKEKIKKNFSGQPL